MRARWQPMRSSMPPFQGRPTAWTKLAKAWERGRHTSSLAGAALAACPAAASAARRSRKWTCGGRRGRRRGDASAFPPQSRCKRAIGDTEHGTASIASSPTCPTPCWMPGAMPSLVKQSIARPDAHRSHRAGEGQNALRRSTATSGSWSDRCRRSCLAGANSVPPRW